MTNKKRVSYLHDNEIGSFFYATKHAMKPNRIRMAHELILAYGIYKKMEIYQPHHSSHLEMQRFHSKDYVEFLSKINPSNQNEYEEEKYKYYVGQDCPIFENMFEFCQISAGGSVAGAKQLNHNLTDIAINWAGGLHHAKKSQASGFCYINDIVLGILELLKYFPRVLYIDIDIHHGDGVEEAFFNNDRVMTCSFHKYGDGYFPGTGNIKDIGKEKGKYYSVNFPLHDGIYENEYYNYFKQTINSINYFFQPSAIVMQCGADSLAGDRLGCFNLEIKGHGRCVSYVKSLNIPLLILGGGGYTPRNVAKCWTYETALLTDNSDLSEKLPETEYTDYFGRNPNLFVLEVKNCHLNKNTKRYLEETYKEIYENLRLLRGAPSVEMEISTNEPDLKLFDINQKKSMEDLDPDVRIHPLLWSKLIEPNNSFLEDPDLSLKYFVQSPILDPEISNENLFNFDYLLKEKEYFSKFKQPNLGLKRNFTKEPLDKFTDSKDSLKISIEPDQKKKIFNK
ncbi:histone deacetylase rpd3 [Anaeramoeba flamelloides]|uniref:histone deacetylase n=1 Tax=Anaeramoeba flamelloides TaxID=1746091 RepID=A0AAV7YD59_9EUKA|nr:histone deacetylase rpd3 [Anaeramoeba flamelloides]